MKFKILQRSAKRETRDAKGGVYKQARNLDPKLHPLEKAKEYKRAVNAAKMERMFAKPFLFALDGHADGVYSSTTSQTNMNVFVSGAGDGEVRVWDVASKRCMWSAYAHESIVRGLTATPDGLAFLSCGDDKVVNMYDIMATSAGVEEAVRASAGPSLPSSTSSSSSSASSSSSSSSAGAATGGASAGTPSAAAAAKEALSLAAAGRGAKPVATWSSKFPLTSVHHSPNRDQFVTAGQQVLLWDHARADPVSNFSWGCDTTYKVRFNPADPTLLGSVSSDCSVGLYDLRAGSPVRKVVLETRSNALDWNPREPMNFVVGNEDAHCYTFDMRHLKRALCVHKDHVSAVMDVAFSPTGKEFATASYDRTVRIFGARQGRSREAYHAKRMQRVFTVHYSRDSKYILSGSDDTNVRVWKANASEQLGRLSRKEKDARDYREKLKKRYGHLPEVRRVTHSRRTPGNIKKAHRKIAVMEESRKRKLDNLIRNSKEGTVELRAERTKRIRREET